MKRKIRKIRLKYKKERVLLSDILPYELPFIFSNRYFYRFLVENKIEIKDNILTWKDSIDEGAKLILMVMCNQSYKDMQTQNTSIGKKLVTIPFTYAILHKPTKHREISIIHPINQIKMVDFYNRNKNVILYLCSKSHFSIRYPHKMASYFYYKDRLHKTLLGKKTDSIEMFSAEYENLKTFFSYKRYSNIYKFYDDYRYQRAEKKFEHLIKFDIQSCFDNIYTHTITWTIYGGKENYKSHFRSGDFSLGDKWDKIMQEMNYNETNGIVIGPEFSRLFAEVILQHIDQIVERKLKKKGYKLNVDYECYRYVDDYFLFYNNVKVKEDALQLFEIALKEFKLNISNEKTITYDRPFITPISKAKLSIKELILEMALSYSGENQNNQLESENEDEDDEDGEEEDNTASKEKVEKSLSIRCQTHFQATSFCEKFKRIVSDNDIEFKDVVNFLLVKLYIQIERQLKKYDKIYKPLCYANNDESILVSFNKLGNKDQIEKQMNQMERTLAKFLFQVVEAIFFIYASCKRVNTTLRVLQILDTIIIYLDNEYFFKGKGKIRKIKRFTEYIREIVFKKIRDEVSLVLNTAPIDEYVQLETMYFLVLLRTMDKKYQLNTEEIKKYLKFDDEKNKDDLVEIFSELNAISIIILLYYFGNRPEYKDLKAMLIDGVIKKYYIREGRLNQYAEYTILALDIAACPYIEKDTKIKILKKVGLEKVQVDQVLDYLKRKRYMFTKWRKINMTKELSAKISKEVYS